MLMDGWLMDKWNGVEVNVDNAWMRGKVNVIDRRWHQKDMHLLYKWTYGRIILDI